MKSVAGHKNLNLREAKLVTYIGLEFINLKIALEDMALNETT